jgi:hypothetical protein
MKCRLEAPDPRRAGPGIGFGGTDQGDQSQPAWARSRSQKVSARLALRGFELFVLVLIALARIRFALILALIVAAIALVTVLDLALLLAAIRHGAVGSLFVAAVILLVLLAGLLLALLLFLEFLFVGVLHATAPFLCRYEFERDFVPPGLSPSPQVRPVGWKNVARVTVTWE